MNDDQERIGFLYKANSVATARSVICYAVGGALAFLALYLYVAHDSGFGWWGATFFAIWGAISGAAIEWQVDMSDEEASDDDTGSGATRGA
jgi:hypothetical protein